VGLAAGALGGAAIAGRAAALGGGAGISVRAAAALGAPGGTVGAAAAAGGAGGAGGSAWRRGCTVVAGEAWLRKRTPSSDGTIGIDGLGMLPGVLMSCALDGGLLPGAGIGISCAAADVIVIARATALPARTPNRALCIAPHSRSYRPRRAWAGAARTPRRPLRNEESSSEWKARLRDIHLRVNGRAGARAAAARYR
jgi:hypothetical protein